MSIKPTTNWLSLADMMTGLMLVFLLISILFISQTQASLKEDRATKSEIYQELIETFKDKQNEWQMVIKDDLTIIFKNPDFLFKQDSSIITRQYKDILNEFIPKYIEIINKEKYKDSIREVRIEGHTGDTSDQYNTYIRTIELSQDRAREILKYIMNSKYYKNNIGKEDQKKLKFWFTANGYGLGRAIDFSGDFVYDTNNGIDKSSRRVVFSIITNSEKLIEEIFKN